MDSMKTDIKEIGYGDGRYVGMTQNRVQHWRNFWYVNGKLFD